MAEPTVLSQAGWGSAGQLRSGASLPLLRLLPGLALGTDGLCLRYLLGFYCVLVALLIVTSILVNRRTPPILQDSKIKKRGKVPWSGVAQCLGQGLHTEASSDSLLNR